MTDASTSHPSVTFTEHPFDDDAVLDHPTAVREVLDRTGADTTQAIIHCQGSTSFAMAAVAGLLPDVTTIVSNAVSLHPVIPRFSRFKINYAVPLIARVTPYFNPQWGRDEPGWRAAMFRTLVRLTHRECSNDVCRMVSFTYGTGFPTLWSHDNISVETHAWLSHEFARVPLTFFDQMGASLRRGSLTPTGRYDELPVDLVARAPRTDARFGLFAGADNLCFLPREPGTHRGMARRPPQRRLAPRRARLRPPRHVHGRRCRHRRLPADDR